MSRYKLLRDSIQTGDIGSFKGLGLTSRIIRIFSAYSHVAMFVWVTFHKERRLMFAHAVYPTGVVYVNASHIINAYKGEVRLHRKTPAIRQDLPLDYPGMLADFMAKNSGLSYDRGGVLKKIPIAFISRMFKNSADAYYCSEIIAASDRHFGLTDTERLRPDEVINQYPQIYVSRGLALN